MQFSQLEHCLLLHVCQPVQNNSTVHEKRRHEQEIHVWASQPAARPHTLLVSASQSRWGCWAILNVFMSFPKVLNQMWSRDRLVQDLTHVSALILSCVLCGEGNIHQKTPERSGFMSYKYFDETRHKNSHSLWAALPTGEKQKFSRSYTVNAFKSEVLNIVCNK